jgi:hypothetical protein
MYIYICTYTYIDIDTTATQTGPFFRGETTRVNVQPAHTAVRPEFSHV